MKDEDLLRRLRDHGIQPTAQRLAVARLVLDDDSHPTADEVWARARRRSPTLSRATVYNTLNLFVERALLATQVVREGALVFDPNVAPHHHFVDDATGEVHDVPWDALRVSGEERLRGFEVRGYQVVLRGRKRTRPGPSKSE